MEESRRVLKRPHSASTSETGDEIETQQRGGGTDTTDTASTTTPLDLSRRSPPHTPPSGLTAATVPRVGPLSPCQGARPPSRPPGLGVAADERRPGTETVPPAPASSTLTPASPSFTPDHANMAAGPIATQVNATRLSFLPSMGRQCNYSHDNSIATMSNLG